MQINIYFCHCLPQIFGFVPNIKGVKYLWIFRDYKTHPYCLHAQAYTQTLCSTTEIFLMYWASPLHGNGGNFEWKIFDKLLQIHQYCSPSKFCGCTIYIHLQNSVRMALDASVMISLHCIFGNKDHKDWTNASFSMCGERKPTSLLSMVSVCKMTLVSISIIEYVS